MIICGKMLYDSVDLQNQKRPELHRYQGTSKRQKTNCHSVKDALTPAKRGRLGLILSWVILKTLKMVSAISLALMLNI